ncbi:MULTISPECIES: hypothetical protein [Streptomyces]|uniref:hypothetical protein n=1 Tax=Streptomyces TaxID=1883 RepID=UPI00123B2E46|nr:hypothetical protein [Streptomyces venezuelae]
MRPQLRVWPVVPLAVLATACAASGQQPATSAKPSPGQHVAAAPVNTAGVKEGSVCEATLTEAQQKAIGVWEAEPMSGKGEVSCYFSMTPDEDNPAGYVVSVFRNEEALLGTADGTDPSPTKAVPVMVKGRGAARQVMYGDDWRASLTVDIGAGQFLFVERYSPAHVVTERDLNAQARKVAEQALANLEKAGAEGA